MSEICLKWIEKTYFGDFLGYYWCVSLLLSHPGWGLAADELPLKNYRRFWEERYVKYQVWTLSPNKTKHSKRYFNSKLFKFAKCEIRKFRHEKQTFFIDKQ